MAIVNQFVELKEYVRLHPFDTATEEGRSKERQRRALLTMLADLFSRACGFVVMILTLRIALPYLGQERYGILATIISFSTILMALDLGIGNALVGMVAKLAVGADEKLNRLINRALWVLTFVGMTIAALLLLASQFAPLGWAFKGAGPDSLTECRNTLALFALLFGTSIPLGAMRNVYHGLQKGYVVHIVSAVATVISLGLLYLLTRFHARMPAFLFVGYGMQVLSGGALLLPFLFQGGISAPRLEYFSGDETRELLKVGGLFLLLQVGVMAGWGADPLILSSRIGPLAVVVFTLADKASQLIAVPLYILNKPLWATYAEALARGDKSYIRNTLKRSLAVTAGIATSIAMVLYFGSQTIFRFLSKNVVEVPRGFLAIFLLWTIIRALGDCLAMYLNGVHVLRPQVILVMLFIVVSIPAKIIFAGTSSLTGFIGGDDFSGK